MEKKKTFWEYFIQSLAGAGSLILAISFFFILYNLGRFISGIGKLLDIMMPVIYGLVIAFVLGPLCEWLEQFLLKHLPKRKEDDKRQAMARGLGVALSLIIALLIIIIVMVLVLPQLFSSIVTMVNSVPGASARLTKWVQRLLADNPDMQSQILATYNDVSTTALDWVQNTFLPRFQELLNNLSSGVVGFMVVLKNLVLGIIISAYVLFNMRLYKAQTKKMIYGLFPVKWANSLLFLLREVRDVFSGFLTGKLLDSLIIGMICFIGMTIFGFPYPILISTIVGVTNIIPYFGPFIGAIPSAVLVLTVSPWQALYFLIFILVLQQLDGNIIGPRILGSTTGISSFWVLISLLLFGGMFSVLGMIIGVPVFAVLYDLAERGIRWALERRNLPVPSITYERIDYIDPESRELIELTEKPVVERKEKREAKRLEKLRLIQEIRNARKRQRK